MDCRNKIGAREAAAIAEQYARSKGWEWQGPVAANRVNSRWLIRTNLPEIKRAGGQGVELYVDCASGAVTGSGLVTRPSRDHAEHFTGDFIELYPHYLNEPSSSGERCEGETAAASCCGLGGFLHRALVRPFLPSPISQERALEIARHAFQEQGWPSERLDITKRSGHWEICSNIGQRGGNARLSVDRFTGAILGGGYVKI